MPRSAPRSASTATSPGEDAAGTVASGAAAAGIVTARGAVPRHVELAARVREQVRTGALKPGERLPSFGEMRAQLGVSQDTWERMHRILEQEGLVVRERRRGTFVAPAKPAYPQTGILGFLSGTHHAGTQGCSPYWVALLQGVQSAAFRHGFEVLLLRPDSAIRWERLDGVLMSEHEFDRIGAVPPGMCAVSLVAETERIACVVPDNYRATYELTTHLLALGHRDIAFYLFPESLDSQQRLAGYQAALQKEGLRFRQELVRVVELEEPRESFQVRGRLNMEAWLRADWTRLGATAILAHNDEFALGVLEVLATQGLRVPEDIQVAGFDGLQGPEFERAHLTTAVVPLQEIGRAGVELLVQQLQGCAPGPIGDETAPAGTTMPTGGLAATGVGGTGVGGIGAGGTGVARKLVLPTPIRVGATTGPLGGRPLACD